MPWFHGSLQILLCGCICANRAHGCWIIINIEIKGIIAVTLRSRWWFMYCFCHCCKWYNVMCRVFMMFIMAFCFIVIGRHGGVCGKKKEREWGAVRYSKLQKRSKEMWSCDRGHRTQHMQKMAILLDQQTETRCLAICATTCKSHVLISPRHPIFAITSLTSFICFHLEWHVW